jgi:hypothetical protein
MSKTTAQDVYQAFVQHQPRAYPLILYNDESGSVEMELLKGKQLFIFNNFDDAMKQFAAAARLTVGDQVAYGPHFFTVTDVYRKSLRADRALYGEPEHTVYVPLSALTRRPGTRVWAV